jgi:enoyl-CoA hydratase
MCCVVPNKRDGASNSAADILSMIQANLTMSAKRSGIAFEEALTVEEFTNLIYEEPEPGIARIWLNRAEKRNAQDTKLLDELNRAFMRAVENVDVKAIILAAKGPHFSAGHDLRETNPREAMRDRQLVGSWKDNDWSGVEGHYSREKEIYEGYCKRWRDLSKVTIAAVQGKCIAGGLMLVWPCDFVVAADNAVFQDNTIDMGIPGVEYFAHPWELGVRKAKEFLLLGEPLDAAEARSAGMVNRVVPEDRLQEEAMAMARKLAAKPGLALKLGKDALNATYSAQGFDNVQRAAFNAHHLAHAHYRISQDGSFVDKQFMASFKKTTVTPSDQKS